MYFFYLCMWDDIIKIIFTITLSRFNRINRVICFLGLKKWQPSNFQKELTDDPWLTPIACDIQIMATNL